MEIKRNAFKAYDIRGRVPDELNEEVAYRLGWAFADRLVAKTVVVGRDIRLSSESLSQAVIRGLRDRGCSVIDIGLCGTEMIYFAVKYMQTDGGIMVTASHNPMEYNGMKLVQQGARPISGDTGLRDIEEQVVTGDFSLEQCSGIVKGSYCSTDIMKPYIKHLLTYIDTEKLLPLKIVVNPGNGCAGPVLDALEPFLPFHFIKVHHQPDGTFPHGIPNPLLPEGRAATAAKVRECRADLGLAWDGDFDRCFFFDEQGNFIEGYYIVGFLAQAFLRKQPGAKIIYDPRLTWNTIELVEEAGGVPIISKTGHAFLKEKMRAEDAVYGGEMSAHHYFKGFSYCDSGMLPWLLVAESLSLAGKPLSQMVQERIKRYPVSGEINCTVPNGPKVLASIKQHFVSQDAKVNYIDGLSVEYAAWRFNVRMSNTEPLLRLNVESRGNEKLMLQKAAEILQIIQDIVE